MRLEKLDRQKSVRWSKLQRRGRVIPILKGAKDVATGYEGKLAIRSLDFQQLY